MFPLQQQPHMEDSADPLVAVQEMQFWLDKAVAWGQAETGEAQRDTCQHLSRLRDFIQQLLQRINSMVSYHENRFMLNKLGWILLCAGLQCLMKFIYTKWGRSDSLLMLKHKFKRQVCHTRALIPTAARTESSACRLPLTEAALCFAGAVYVWLAVLQCWVSQAIAAVGPAALT